MYENDKTIYVVMEFLEGKKLFELIKEKTDREGNFTEEEAKKIIKKLLEAITYCHSKEIMHKDLKPKKIFIEKEGEIKITDFAMSKWDFLNKEQLMQATSYYLAPEVLKKVRTAKSDLWSVGAITYTMLSGFLPFVSDANQTVFQKANKGEYSKRTMNIKKYNFDHKVWDTISEEAKDFIEKTLNIDINKRLSAKDCLSHDWFLVNETQ